MRVLTHNLLACQARSCISTSANFPLGLSNIQLEVVEAPLNAAFLRGLIPKLDWSALVYAARSLGDEQLPELPPSEAILQAEADQVVRLQQEYHDALLAQSHGTSRGNTHYAEQPTGDEPHEDEKDEEALWAEAMNTHRIPPGTASTLQALHHILIE